MIDDGGGHAPASLWLRVKAQLRTVLPAELRERLKGPVYELTAHFLLSMLALMFITIVDGTARLFGQGEKLVPVVHVKLADWFFDLDVLAVTVILMVGLIKAIREMW